MRGALLSREVRSSSISHTLENLTGLDKNKERSANSALTTLSPRATTELREWPRLTRPSVFLYPRAGGNIRPREV